MYIQAEEFRLNMEQPLLLKESSTYKLLKRLNNVRIVSAKKANGYSKKKYPHFYKKSATKEGGTCLNLRLPKPLKNQH